MAGVLYLLPLHIYMEALCIPQKITSQTFLTKAMPPADAAKPEVTLDRVMLLVNAWADDPERDLDTLQDILMQTTRLEPLFQAAIVKRLGELKTLSPHDQVGT